MVGGARNSRKMAKLSTQICQKDDDEATSSDKFEVTDQRHPMVLSRGYCETFFEINSMRDVSRNCRVSLKIVK